MCWFIVKLIATTLIATIFLGLQVDKISSRRFARARGKFVQAPKITKDARQGSLPPTTTQMVYGGSSVPISKNDEVPAWDALDRHVLRFYAYGKETVPDTNLENSRVNMFTILYYLQDDTVQVSMPMPDNSGCGIFSAIGVQGDKGRIMRQDCVEVLESSRGGGCSSVR